MDYINTIRDGKKYRIPYEDLEEFMADGGKFASQADKDLAMKLEQIPMSDAISTPASEEQAQESYSYPGLGGVARDVGESLITAPGSLLKGAMNVPEHLENLGQYRLEHGLLPTLGQTALGVPDFAAKILSAPQVGARYLGGKFAPESSITKGLQQTPTPYELLQQGEDKLGLSPTDIGEAEARGVGELAVGGGAMKALESALARMGMITTEATGGGGDPIHAALGAALGEKAASTLPKIPGRIRESRETSKLDPEALQTEAEAQKQTVSDLQARDKAKEAATAKAQDLESQLTEIPDPTKKLPDLRFEGQHGYLQDLANESNANLARAHAEQGLQLGGGNENIPAQDFETRAAPLVIQHVEDIKGEISPRYDAINEGARDVTIDIPNHARAQEIQTQMNKLIDNGMINPMNDTIYDGILEQLEQQWPGEAVESIPAPQYINTYKSTRDLARIARSRSRQEGLDQSTRQRWEAKANELEPIVRHQRGVLQNALPNNLFDELLATDRLWGENVIPFYRNKIYQEARQHGRTPKNMIDQTMGNAPHQQIMQRAIQSNPELNRLALGQQYAARPHELLTPTERTQPYINSHAPTSNLLEVQRRAHTSNQRAQQQLEALQPESQFRAQQRQGVAAQTKAQIKAREDITKKLNDTIKELNELEKDSRNLDAEMSKLGLTKERLERRQKYDADKQKLKNRLWNNAKIATSYAVGGPILVSVYRTLFKN